MAFLLPFQYLHLPNFKFPYELVICLDLLDLNLRTCLKHWENAQKRVQAKLILPGPYLDPLGPFFHSIRHQGVC